MHNIKNVFHESQDKYTLDITDQLESQSLRNFAIKY